MNESLDLRNRILKMRESNNLTVSKTDTLNNDLMSEFESTIKDENKKVTNSNNDTVIDKNKKTISNSIKHNSEIPIDLRNETENKNINRTVYDNDAQFLMLANKFNEAVEVILELSQKVEKLERDAYQNSNKSKINKDHFSFFNFKTFVFLLLMPLIFLGLFTLPFDFSVIKSIISDIISNL